MLNQFQQNKKVLCVEANQREYNDGYHRIPWVGAARAREAEEQRGELLAMIGPEGKFFCGRTKVVLGDPSPGCRRCMDGTWSCLFIHGHCNSDCFFCPSRQDGPDVPMTNGLEFPETGAYAQYLRRMDICGVSFSGGEPLLVPDKILAFLRPLKKTFGDSIFFWMYTNGRLVTPEILGRLRDAGLDEIRFNIASSDYALDKVALARGVIPHVTVEIPAVPEDYARLSAMLTELADTGVQYLNLHQLRLTPYNIRHLLQRDYTYVHGDKVTVLESELTALRILADVRARGLPLAVNYCSFVYKNRYQGRAARRRAALIIRRPYETVTDNGFLRCLFARCDDASRPRILEALHRHGQEGSSFVSERDRILIDPALLDRIDHSGTRICAAYDRAHMTERLSYRYPFEKVVLDQSKTIFIERESVLKEQEISRGDRGGLERWFSGRAGSDLSCLDPEVREAVGSFECVPEGLQDYF